MRVFGILGLLLALVIVGLLAKKQLAPSMVPALPIAGASAPASTPVGSVRDQSTQFQQQIKNSIDAAMQPRAMPDDAAP